MKPDDFYNSTKYKNALYSEYREIFSNTIKESFLISMHSLIVVDPRFFALASQRVNHDFFNIGSSIRGHLFSTLNLCKMIVMNHYSNTVCLNDNERGKLQNDSKYKELLKEQVIKMTMIEKLATFDFSTQSLETFLPLIFYASSLTNYLGGKYDELSANKISTREPYDSDFNMLMLYKMIMKIKACIALADIRAIDELAAVFRSLIELFMSYAALWDTNKEAISLYYEHNKATYYFNNDDNHKIPDEVNLDLSKVRGDKIKFINYGWISHLKEFDMIPKSSRDYNLKTLAKILDKKYSSISSNFGSGLYKLFKACNPQIHASALMMNYFELELHVFINISAMLNFICEIMSTHLFDIDFKYENFNIKDLLSIELAKAKEILSAISKNESLLSKTNIDYRNRAFCSQKIKQH